MMEEVIELLKKNPEISGYEIKQVDSDERQLFYVGKNLETNRAVRTTDVNVTIYVDFDEYRGSSSFALVCYDDAETIEKKIQDAIVKAKAVKNKWYPLADKVENIHSSIKLRDSLNDTALKIANAIFKADHYADGQLNATEIFVSLKHHTFINSNQVEHHYDQLSAQMEIIPSFTGIKEDVELIDEYSFTDFDEDKITKHVEQQMEFARLRGQAKPLKEIEMAENIPVLTQGESVSYLTSWFAYDASYSPHFMKMNHYQMNQQISDNPFNLSCYGSIEGAANSTPVDANGLPTDHVEIITDGKLSALTGNLRFGYYLQEKKITGSMNCWKLQAETKEISSLDGQPHMIICNFSAPQFEPDNGYFGGEVRLALYYDGKQYIPVTGFSIAGNLFEAIKTVQFLGETVTMASYQGPKYWMFEGMTFNK